MPFFKKTLTLLFLLAGLFMLQAEILVERVNLNRNFPRLVRNSKTVLDCIVTNTDTKAHLVDVRLIPLASGETLNTYNTGKIMLPAKTTAALSFPVQLGTSEAYTIEVRSDGVRLPRKGVVNDIKLYLNNYTQKNAVILNDNDEHPGLPVRNPSFKDKLFFNTVTVSRAPVNSGYYNELAAVLIFRPAFNQYSEEQFRALKSYVAAGGTVIFLHPDAIMEAADTPLADLLPVTPVKKHKVDSLPPVTAKITGFDRTKRWETEILESIERDRGITLMTWESLPLIRVKQYGLGTVKAVMFPVSEKTFGSSSNAGFEKFLSELLSQQQLYPNRKSFENVLDKLTGFEIPDTAEIIIRVTIYLILFFLVLLLGVFFKRSGFAWIAAVLIALGTVGITLLNSASSFASQESVLSEIQLEHAAPFQQGEVYGSCFAKDESVLRANMPNGVNGEFSSVMESPYISNFFVNFNEDFYDPSRENKIQPRQVRHSFPVETQRDARGKHQLIGMHVAPRTSRQFMLTYAKDGEVPAGTIPEAELFLTEKGLDMAAYTIPEQYRTSDLQGVYLVMPGGARKVNVKDGVCTLEENTSFFLNEMEQALMEAICNGSRKQNPYLALVYPVRKNMVELNVKMLSQGRRVVMIPAHVTINSRKITVPKEMLVHAPGNSLARASIQGNMLVGKASLMTDQTLTVAVSLPVFLHGIFPPEKIKVATDYSISDNVTMQLSITTPSGDVAGKNTEGMDFEFAGSKLANSVNAENCLLLNFKPQLQVNASTFSTEQSLRTKFWNLRSADVEITGSIRSDLPLPLRF